MSDTPKVTVTPDHEALKVRLMDALRKTGHVTEHGLEAVADTALTVTLGSQGAFQE